MTPTLTQLQVMQALRVALIALSGISADDVFLSLRGGALPDASSYLSIQRVADEAYSQATEPDGSARQARRLTVQLSAVGSDDSILESLTNALSLMRTRSAPIVAMSTAGVAVHLVGSVRLTPQVWGSDHRMRGTADLRLGYVRALSATSGDLAATAIDLDVGAVGAADIATTTVHSESV